MQQRGHATNQFEWLQLLSLIKHIFEVRLGIQDNKLRVLYLINVTAMKLFLTVSIVLCFTCLTLWSKFLFYNVNVSLWEKSTNFKRFLLSYWIGEKVVGSTSAVRDLHSKVKNLRYWASFNKGSLSPHVRGTVRIMVKWLNLSFPNNLNFLY